MQNNTQPPQSAPPIATPEQDALYRKLFPGLTELEYRIVCELSNGNPVKWDILSYCLEEDPEGPGPTNIDQVARAVAHLEALGFLFTTPSPEPKCPYVHDVYLSALGMARFIMSYEGGMGTGYRYSELMPTERDEQGCPLAGALTILLDANLIELVDEDGKKVTQLVPVSKRPAPGDAVATPVNTGTSNQRQVPSIPFQAATPQAPVITEPPAPSTPAPPAPSTPTSETNQSKKHKRSYPVTNSGSGSPTDGKPQPAETGAQ